MDLSIVRSEQDNQIPPAQNNVLQFAALQEESGGLDTPGVHVVEVPIDYADNDRILNKDVRELSAALPV